MGACELVFLDVSNYIFNTLSLEPVTQRAP
jgi:hypothetical protein